jgi:cystathionine beta-lyase/cystathionine gamma-synthase
MPQVISIFGPTFSLRVDSSYLLIEITDERSVLTLVGSLGGNCSLLLFIFTITHRMLLYPWYRRFVEADATTANPSAGDVVLV